MGFYLNGTEIDGMYLNGTEIDAAYLNGVKVLDPVTEYVGAYAGNGEWYYNSATGRKLCTGTYAGGGTYPALVSPGITVTTPSKSSTWVCFGKTLSVSGDITGEVELKQKYLSTTHTTLAVGIGNSSFVRSEAYGVDTLFDTLRANILGYKFIGVSSYTTYNSTPPTTLLKGESIVWLPYDTITIDGSSAGTELATVCTDATWGDYVPRYYTATYDVALAGSSDFIGAILRP